MSAGGKGAIEAGRSGAPLSFHDDTIRIRLEKGRSWAAGAATGAGTGARVCAGAATGARARACKDFLRWDRATPVPDEPRRGPRGF